MNKIHQIRNYNKPYLIIGFLTATLILSSQIIAQIKSHNNKMEIKLSSSAFKDGEFIPVKFSCEGEDISPQLQWIGAPKSTKSFAIIVDDPDAPGGNFVHWVIFNIPGVINKLNENVTGSINLPDSSTIGTNDFGKISYDGPCPPAGNPHRYFFKIFALDNVLNQLKSKITKPRLIKAMQGHIIAEGHLMGKYQRKK
jgi:Raf kinase inhibitor-like YbhB/YbcL family protein